VNNVLRGLGFGLMLALSAASHAQSVWNAQDYDLYFGDFNGDGKTDVLYIAKSPTGISGINLSDGNGPNIPLQSWQSTYLGINWFGNQFTVIVADFNGDGKADVLLQNNVSGNSYLLFANAQGMLTGISQQIAQNTAGLDWSAAQHHLVAGDFTHAGQADLFFQATNPAGTNAVMLSSTNPTTRGQFTATAPEESWSDGYLGFKWATNEALIYAGDFNGDGYTDLLIQAKPVFVMIDYDVPFPVPTFAPHVDGVVLAETTSPIFQIGGMQSWNVNAFGANWSPLVSNVVVGDFNGGLTTDVILQGRRTGQGSELLIGNASGAIFSTGVALASNVTWTADSYRLLVGQFGGSGAQGVYFQALTPTGTNLYASNINGSSVSTTPQTPVIAGDIVSYTYDALGRLVTVTHSGAADGNVQLGYSYDKAGNRSQVTTTGALQ